MDRDYTIIAPDGREMVITGPDNASREQLRAAAERAFQMPAPAPSEQQPQPTPMSRMSKIGQGMVDPINGGAQLLTHVLPDGVVNAGNELNNWIADKTGLVAKLPEGGVDQQVKEQEAAYQAQRAAAGESGFDGYRTIGNVLSPANLAIASRGATAAMGLGGRMALGSGIGAATNALAPVTEGDYGSEKLKQMGIGGVMGGAFPAVAAGFSRVISPKASVNPNVALLKSEGVKPTVGQTLGGWANSLEEKAQSIPLVGDAITAARGKAREQFNNAAINRAVAPIGKKVEGTGQAAVAEAGDLLSQAYDDAIGKVKFVKFDNKFQQDSAQLKQMAQSLVGPYKAKFNKLFADRVDGRMSPSGSMLGPTIKQVDSELGDLARTFGKSPDGAQQEFADAVKQLQALVREQIARSDPAFAAAKKATDTGWANLVRVEGAAKIGKNAEGVFTPGQLNTAIQGADQSVRKRAVARGQALMQDLGNAGQSVLGNKVPDSGTAGRLWGGGAILGSTALYSQPAALGLLGGAVGGAAAYTPWAQSLLRGAVSARPESAQAIAELLKRTSPMLSPAGGLLGLEMAE